MGLIDKINENKRLNRISKLEDEYKKLYLKCKTDKALDVLNEMFELESSFAVNMLLETYKRGYLYCDISRYDDLYKKKKHPGSYYHERNTVAKSMEKIRYYLQRMLDRYGDKVKMPHTKLSKEDNQIIGGLKVRIAYTYFYRYFSTESVQVGTRTSPALTVGDKIIAPEQKYPIREDVFVLKDPEGNEYAKYMDWIRDAVLLNQNYEAFARLAIAYWKEFDLFGAERDVDKATAMIIAAFKNYNEYFSCKSPASNFKSRLTEYDLSDILRELAKENQVADVYYQKICLAREKHRLEGKAAKMALEYARVSLLEEVADVNWYDKRTGEKIENIDAELKKMEAAIADVEKTLESLNV